MDIERRSLCIYESTTSNGQEPTHVSLQPGTVARLGRSGKVEGKVALAQDTKSSVCN